MGFINKKFTDNEINNFKKSNFLFNADMFRDYQDPTIWGFKILFTGINTTAGGLLNSNEDVPGTAAEYLKNIGDTNRLQYLKSFSEMLQRINRESPWYFQKVTGLGDAWKRDFTKPLTKGKITIECLESVDFRLTTMIDLYRKACFDWVNRKEVVPKNLREFDMDIYIVETRRFKWWQNDFMGDMNEKFNTLKDAAADFKADPAASAKTLANAAFVGSVEDDQEFERINHIMFKFRDCEISLESGAKALDSATNVDPSQVSQEIIIDYSYVEESNLNTLYGGDGTGIEVSDYLVGALNIAAFDYTPSGGEETAIGDIIKATLNNLKDKAISSIGSAAIGKAKSVINSALLGNVYGFSPINALNQAQSIAGDPASLIGGVPGAFGGGPSIKNDQKEGNNETIYDGSSTSLTNEQKDNPSRTDVFDRTSSSLENKQKSSSRRGGVFDSNSASIANEQSDTPTRTDVFDGTSVSIANEQKEGNNETIYDGSSTSLTNEQSDTPTRTDVFDGTSKSLENKQIDESSPGRNAF